MSQIPKGSGSRLAQMQAQFQQKQMQEKEAKLLQMLDSQQQKALQKAALNGVLPSNKYSTNINNNNNNNLLMNGNGPPAANVGAGKVRQMFEERRRGGSVNGSISGGNTNGYGSRHGALTGIDKGHPLEPLVVTNNNKSRSSSSKSDPANYVSTNNSSSRTTPNGMRNTHVPPMMKPPNLGSNNRATSLNRERSGSRESPALNHNEPSVNPKTSSVSSANGTVSGGKPYHQRQQHKSSASHPPPPPQNAEESYHDYIPPLPTTTKYSDYAHELEKRENALATKLKRTTISSSPDDNASRSGGGGASPTHKSSSPTLRSVTSSGANSPTRPNSKSPTTMSTPGARSVGRTSVSSVASRAVTVKKTSGVIKSKPSAPPRSSTGPPPGLDECKVCGRYFAPDRIQKHESICKKTTTKKRKVFDPTKMRMQGTEAEPYIRVVSAKASKPAPAATAKKVDWRKKHEDFIATIRAAKEYQAHVAAGGDPKDLPPPPPTDTSDYVQCPYCNRKFSEGAAERHIPKCKTIKCNKNKR
ncbi:Zinc finger C2HC domain-containing protein 1C [Orchesella cincta]|uniref:Zinc finger C2HC domain-containing protein 1C n=1 Tax=Orchesella cincta TaxID=48709 RepID=A0A1D2NBB3_ORCCI|nr:Zinc finger C2HC domain-containing protein 1C [Orchesella cincta]